MWVWCSLIISIVISKGNAAGKQFVLQEYSPKKNCFVSSSIQFSSGPRTKEIEFVSFWIKDSTP